MFFAPSPEKGILDFTAQGSIVRVFMSIVCTPTKGHVQRAPYAVSYFVQFNNPDLDKIMVQYHLTSAIPLLSNLRSLLRTINSWSNLYPFESHIIVRVSHGIARLLSLASMTVLRVVQLFDCQISMTNTSISTSISSASMILPVLYSAVRKVRGQTPKHTKFTTFQDARTLECLIAQQCSEI